MMEINVREVDEQDSLVTVPIITGEVVNNDELEAHSSTTIINVPLVHGDDGTFLNVSNPQSLIITTAADGTVYLDPSQVALFENAVATGNLVPLEDADIGRSGLEPCSSVIPLLNQVNTPPLSEINLPQLILSQRQQQPPIETKQHDENELRPPLGKGPFKCSMCDKLCEKWNQLKKHERTHADDKPFRCSLCNATFNKEVNLTLHRATHNAGNPVCPQCGKRFNRVAGLKAHIMMHEVEENLFCSECGEEFSTQGKLNRHALRHREEAEDKVYNCKQCNREFSKAAELREHLKAHNRIKASLSHRTHKKNIDRSNFNHNCITCGKLFQKPSQLERHLRIHTGEKPFTCEECGKSFNQKGALRIHEMNHNGLKPHSCDFCKATFAQRGNLRAHIQRVHTIVKAGASEEFFYCKECSCVFKKLGALNAHMSRSHPLDGILDSVSGGGSGEGGEITTGSKGVNEVIKQLIDLNGVPTSVMETNKDDGTLRPNLNEELLIANSDLLQQAIQNSGLTAEQQQTAAQREHGKEEIKRTDLFRRLPVRKVAGIRWHQCMYCTKEFKKPSDLVRHIRVHTHEKPFKCELCYRSFTVKSTLTSHQRTHSGIKSFCCSVCERLFSTQGSLKVHLRLHTGDKPFECQHCGKKFRTTGHRKSHLIQHLRDDSSPSPKKVRRGGKRATTNNEVSPSTILPDVSLEEPLVVTENGLVQRLNPSRGASAVLSSLEAIDRPYKCTYCPRGFKKSSHLKQHVRSHTGEKPYQCSTCLRTFVSSGVLNAHQKTHTGEKAYGCTQCEATFTTNGSLKRHMCIHSELRPFMCPYCQKTFKTSVNCKKHIKCHRHQLAVEAAAAAQANVNADQPTTNGVVEQHITENETVEVDPNRDLSLRQSVEHLQHQFVEETVPSLTFDHFTSAAFQLSDQLHPTLDMSTLGDTFVNSGLHSDLTHLLSPSRATTAEPIMVDVVEEGPSTPQQPPTPSPPISPSINIATTTLPVPSTLPGPTNKEIEGKRLNKCSYCDRTFKRVSHVKQHERSHSGEKPFCCSQCNRFFVSMGVLKAHLKTHTGARDFSCHLCNATFTTKGSRNRHMIIHNSSVANSFVSDSYRADLNRKKNSKKGSENAIDFDGMSEEEVTVAVPPPLSDASSFTTSSTKKSKNAIVKFTDAQTVELASQKQETASTVSEKILIASAAEKDRVSEIRDKEAELQHRPRLPHACNRCPKSFKKPSDLVRHLRIHTGEKPFCCQLCHKKFTVKSTLDSHVKTHLKEKRFNCHVCDSNFSTKGSLKVHMRLHTGAKPFKCPHCDLRFRTSGHRKSHIASHQKVDKSRKRKQQVEVEEVEKEEEKGAMEQEVEVNALLQNASHSTITARILENEQTPVLIPQALLNVPFTHNGTLLSNITLSLDPLSVTGDQNVATHGVQLQFSSGVQISNLITQTIQLDANILRQLQEQGNINITLDTVSPGTAVGELDDHNAILQPVSMEMTLKPPSPDIVTAPSSPCKLNQSGTEVNLNITETGEMVTAVSTFSQDLSTSADVTHVCGVCNRSYKRSRSLELHMRKHQGLVVGQGGSLKSSQCNACGKTFSRRSQLQRHTRIHTGEKPFVCGICHRKFNQKNSLQAHMICHTGEKPFHCSICGARFAQKGNLTVHLRNFHQEITSSLPSTAITTSTTTDETVPLEIFNA